jgi:ribonuclease PH
MSNPPRSRQQLRPVSIQKNFIESADASLLYRSGNTMVLCTASVEESVPPWLLGQEKGWITAEYSMLPGSTSPRKGRDRGGKVDGRTTEIQRLIGRSLRAVADLSALGPRTITVDCDVLQADGGTRTASITGGFLALVAAVEGVRDRLPDPETLPLRDSVAAVSVGVVQGEVWLDLDYQLDFAAAVDMNVVMTGKGQYVEVQGTGEEATFSETELAELLRVARTGILELTQIQRQHMSSDILVSEPDRDAR